MERKAFEIFPHFSLEEFEYSETALISRIDNEVPVYYLSNAFLVFCVLELARVRYGHPIEITSGYRDPEVNDLVAGHPNSLHMQALACDVTGSDLISLHSIIKEFKFVRSYVDLKRNYIHFQIDL